MYNGPLLAFCTNFTSNYYLCLACNSHYNASYLNIWNTFDLRSLLSSASRLFHVNYNLCLHLLDNLFTYRVIALIHYNAEIVYSISKAKTNQIMWTELEPLLKQYWYTYIFLNISIIYMRESQKVTLIIFVDEVHIQINKIALSLVNIIASTSNVSAFTVYDLY